LRPDTECIPLIAETIKATKHFLQPKLNAIRCFLTKMRIAVFDMDTEDSEMIQNDIVEIRREINASVEDLHQLLGNYLRSCVALIINWIFLLPSNVTFDFADLR
jgi:hypothetical protein